MTNRYIDLIEKKANSFEKEAANLPVKQEAEKAIAPLKKVLGGDHSAVKKARDAVMKHLSSVSGSVSKRDAGIAAGSAAAGGAAGRKSKRKK